MTEMSLVLNNFIKKNLFTTKSSDIDLFYTNCKLQIHTVKLAYILSCIDLAIYVLVTVTVTKYFSFSFT